MDCGCYGIEMRYEYEKLFDMRVTIENDLAARVADFSFDRIEDATFFRHLGIICDRNQPIFEGYYALSMAK